MRLYLKLATAVLIVSMTPAAAQLSPQQKVMDFQSLASVYAKRYAPADWKKQLNGADVFNLAPWMPRVRASKDDLEYFEIASEYVAQFDDLHSSFRTPSNFVASTGLVVDIYDGKVLIESINRQLLPASTYPFAVGDELLSVDGKSAETLIQEFSKLLRRGNPSTTRRSAADLLTFRPQSAIPRAVELGDSAVMVIRGDGGAEQTYTIPWVKTGLPLTRVGPVPDLRFPAEARTAASDDYMEPYRELTRFSVDAGDPLLRGETYSEETGRMEPRRYLLGWGARNPTFTFPAGFQQRLGRNQSDFHYSGIYESEGKRIGYLRFPNFSPPNYVVALNELATEIAFLKQNTDGLVVDVMRNTGGGCYMLDAAAFLIPRPFWFFGEEIRVTLDRMNSMEVALRLAQLRNADQWIIDYYTVVLEEMKRAYAANRGLTDSLPACSGLTQPFGVATFDNMPATDRNGVAAYDKPLIVLIDEFSTSAGDIFPAMLQDNGRGPLVGTRTNGAGGSISLWPAGMFSEAFTSNTNSLVLRRQPVSVPGYPQASYIENVGVHADIHLDYMTRDNLMQRGAPFVEAFTRILVERIP